MRGLLVGLLLLCGTAHAGLLPGKIDFFRFDGNGIGQVHSLIVNGTVPFAAGGPGGGSHQAGIFSDSNYFSGPAGLRTAYSNMASWTIEFYVTCNSIANSPVPWYHADSTEAFFQILSTGAVKYQRLVGGAAQSAAGVVSTGVVYYFAITYDGTTVRVYQATWTAGTLSAFTLLVSGAFSATTGTVSSIAIGRYGSATTFSLDGYIDNLNLSNYVVSSFPSPAFSTGGGDCLNPAEICVD